VIEWFCVDGQDWQGRMNTALRKAAGLSVRLTIRCLLRRVKEKPASKHQSCRAELVMMAGASCVFMREKEKAFNDYSGLTRCAFM
jgi:hypothetical protein